MPHAHWRSRKQRPRLRLVAGGRYAATGLGRISAGFKVFGDIGNDNCCIFNSKLSNIHVGKLPKKSPKT
jgi:hypothetical protein